MDEEYEVAVVGGGPAGAAAAAFLARAGRRVVLVDRDRFPRDKPCAEYLSPAAEPLLRDLGALEAVTATRPARLRGFRIFAPNGDSFQGDFAATRDAAGQVIHATGLAVPRLALDALLLRQARAAGAEVREGWRLAQIDRAGDATTLTAADGATLRARLVIGADGRHSTVARRLGLRVPGALRKIALVAHLRGIRGLGDYGEMHVAGRRYVGLAPLEADGDLCNVALVVDERRDGRALAGLPQAFLQAALATFPMLRGRCDDVTFARRVLATSGLCVGVRRCSTAGVLLAGDATGYFDPFTGEGIFRALRTAQLAAGVADDALARGDLSAAALARYDQLHRHAFRGKRIIEMIIQSAVQTPPLMNHIAAIMRRRKYMADIVVAVTGDFLPASAVLNPGYLARLVL